MEEKIFVTKPSVPTFEDYAEEIKDIFETHHLTNMGPKHKKFQGLLKDFLKAKEIELFTNGHMAIELSLQALKLKGEVITTPFTFASTTHAIIRSGLTPVFCDIKEDDYTIDEDKIEGLITDKTSAILPVHVYGNPCETEKIEKIAKKHGLKVIYDGAHAFGVEYKGKGIAEYGDVCCFSFHATKVFNTIEGGAAAFTDEEFGKRLYELKNFGIHGYELVDAVGTNAKMNEFCAAMGICNLKRIDKDIEKRGEIYRRYKERLSVADGIKLNEIKSNVKPNYSYFPALFNKEVFGADRNEVFDKLFENGIVARKYFYPLISDFNCYKDTFDSRLTPVAKRVASEVLTLPIYPDLDLKDVDRICDVILSLKK